MSAVLVQDPYVAPRVPSTNPAEEEEALATLCCKWGPKEEATEPLTPRNPLQSETGLASQGTARLSEGWRSEVAIPILETATLPSLKPLSLMGDAETIGSTPCNLTDAGERSRFEKDRRNKNHYAGENGIIADTSLYWDFGSTGTDLLELVCGTERQNSGIELLDECGSEIKMEDDWSCEGLYSECEEKVDHSYSRLEKYNGNGKGGATIGREGNGISHDLGLLPTKDGSRADSVALQDGVPPLGNILVLPTGDGSVENLQTGFSCDLVLSPTKDGSVVDSVAVQNDVFPLQNGVPKLQNILVPPTGDGSIENLQTGFSCDLVLLPTKDGSVVDSVAVQNDVFPLQNGVPNLQNILVLPTEDGSLENLQNCLSPLQNGIPHDLNLPPTKDGSGADSVTLQSGVSPLQNGVCPLQNVFFLPSGDGSSANLQNSGSCQLNLLPTKDGALADSITLQSGAPPLQNGVIPSAAGGSSGSAPLHNHVLLLIRGGSMESNTALQNDVSPLQNIVLPSTEDGSIEDRIIFQHGVPSLCDPVLLPTIDQGMNNQISPLPIDGELAVLDKGSKTLCAERNSFSYNLSINSHSPPLYCDPESDESALSQEKCPETTKTANEADITSGVSLDGEHLGACRMHLPLNEEMPSTSQNGGNNEIGGLETRTKNMMEALRPSVPYVDDLCLVLETCTISEGLKIITERDVDESNEIIQISVRKPDETQHFIPEERQIDDRSQTLFLKPEETQTLPDEDSALKKRPDPSESSVEKTELLTSAFPADKEEIAQPFKELENTTKIDDTMPDDPSEITSSALQNGGLLPDILMCPPQKCLKALSSSSRKKRRKILETEGPFDGLSRRMESIRDNNRALHLHWGSPKWPKTSAESSGNNRRLLSKPIPPQIVRSVHSDYPLRTIKHPFSLPKMAAEVPQTSPCNMDPPRRMTGQRITSLVDIFKPSKRTKEMSLLRKLSVLANTISPPQRSKPALNIPRFGRKMIPDLLSSVVNANVQKSNLQSTFSLFPPESAGFCILDLRSKLSFATPLFQFKMVPVPIQKSTPTWKETAMQLPFEWTFSILFSQSITGPILNLSSVKKDGGCPVGLQTILALFSPGYSRLWARKLRLPVRRLTFFQFTGASKDPNPPHSNLFASLLSTTFDNGLPTWRQFDPPSSEVPPLHSAQEATSAVSTFPSPWMCLNLQNSTTMLPPVTGKSMELPVSPKSNTRWEPSFSASMPTCLSTPEPTWSCLPAPAFPVCNSLEELEVPVLAPPQTTEPEKKKPKKVSQIRIRKTIPKPDPNLTPMGLPRPKRLQKTEFSLEEIYTNKNYKSPPATRSLETIFEEPKERRGGAWVWVSHQKRRRVLEFPDFTLPRKRRPRGRLHPTSQGFTRAQKAALGGRELDALLLQRLTDLEAFCAQQDDTES